MQKFLKDNWKFLLIEWYSEQLRKLNEYNRLLQEDNISEDLSYEDSEWLISQDNIDWASLDDWEEAKQENRHK